MKALLQKVKSAYVVINNEVYGEINTGYVIFFCVEKGDYEDLEYKTKLKWIVDKILNLRLFEENNPDNENYGKMTNSLQDIKGDMLIISQFTLAADVSRGRKPDFTKAEKPDYAKLIYNEFIDLISSDILGKVATGIFGADMDVSLINNGPYTILVEK